MADKLRVVKLLGNPRARKKPARKKPLRRRTKPRRVARSLSGKWVVRLVTTDGRALWRTKTGWTPGRQNARVFEKQSAAASAAKSSDYVKRHRDWVVVDVLPA